MQLSPLSATEAAGITISLVSPEFGEMATATFADAQMAAKNFRHIATMPSDIGMIPRTQSAVDVMAEVLA